MSASRIHHVQIPIQPYVAQTNSSTGQRCQHRLKRTYVPSKLRPFDTILQGLVSTAVKVVSLRHLGLNARLDSGLLLVGSQIRIKCVGFRYLELDFSPDSLSFARKVFLVINSHSIGGISPSYETRMCETGPESTIAGRSPSTKDPIEEDRSREGGFAALRNLTTIADDGG
ncbi:uncharacterized protein PAC_11399 [Phialocephala subalpina]|uniref:Uncharacterized protein n=1 Tax=Phialocephala subalpina TaxID=576137 RepID=A0A1L7X915_9HELO|nr:uncharacterized protein PAC_11399 [Phialocephala subalpina]